MKFAVKLPISVIILTYDEELNLENCLKSVYNWADEIFVVDSYSTDKTLEIAKKYDCKIFQRKFENQAKQFNWALNNLEIKNNWILRLDADEYLTEELKNEINEILPKVSLEISGFCIKRRVYFMNRWIKHGGYYPSWFLRLFRKDRAKYEEREVDEHLILSEGKSLKLKNDFIDNNQKNLEWWIGKQNNHSSREVLAMLDKNKEFLIRPIFFGEQANRKRWFKEKIYYKSPIFFRAFFYFIYRYFFRLGFLDGREGLIFHFLSALWYRFIVDAKFYKYKKYFNI